ncbi:MAG: NAD(P)H-hydrate dehydratase [Opitutaceae bacterium]|nr:NAD(P)H-hydrate dehydratase [Opitutaceae bacterium]
MNGLHPILTCREAIAWENEILGDVESAKWAAMELAGKALAESVLQDANEIGPLPDDMRLLILVGKGHNGGDALIALRHVLRVVEGASAVVAFSCGFEALKLLSRKAFEELRIEHGDRVEFQLSYGRAEGELGEGMSQCLSNAYDICLDGLVGMQFCPPLRGPAAAMVVAVNGNPLIRLRGAVDLPSGIGDESGEVSFRADFTYATGIVKAPLLESKKAENIGRIRYLDLGFFSQKIESKRNDFVITKKVLDPLCSFRPSISDKRSNGHLFVLSGSRTMPGAVLMSVLAALRSGVGLVTAFVPESLVAHFASQAPEAMWVPWPETPNGSLALEGRHLLLSRVERCTGLLIGPGMGKEEETRALVRDIASTVTQPLVLDADALMPDVVEAVAKQREGAVVVCTPHVGEFERLSGGPSSAETLMQYSQKMRVITCLKGPVTRISDGKAIYHNLFGGPVLARGGSGDLLAGLLGGLLARRGSDGLEAAIQAVVWHGRAADELARECGQVAVRTTDLLSFLSDVF